MKRLFILFLSMITLSMNAERTTQDHSITIFVHGTYPVRRFLYALPDRLKGLMYCPQGLSLAKDLPNNFHFRKLAIGCCDLDSKNFSLDQFYTFGWTSEKIYHHVRDKAAKSLVQEVQKLCLQYYQEYKVIPKLRLIGFSHGANVVINTADYLPIVVGNGEVKVEAWLFGVPVQEVNKIKVDSSNFDEIYSVYSESDWVQRMDPQGIRYTKLLKSKIFWSDRRFEGSSKIKEINFTVNGKSIGHVIYRTIFKYFPLIKKSAEQQFAQKETRHIQVDLKV